MSDTKNTLPEWDLSEYYSGLDDPETKEHLKEDLAAARAFEAKYHYCPVKPLALAVHG